MRVGLTVVLVVLLVLLLQAVFERPKRPISFSQTSRPDQEMAVDISSEFPRLRAFSFQVDLLNAGSSEQEFPSSSVGSNVLFDESAMKVALAISRQAQNLSGRSFAPGSIGAGCLAPLMMPSLRGCYHFLQLQQGVLASDVPALTGCGAEQLKWV